MGTVKATASNATLVRLEHLVAGPGSPSDFKMEISGSVPQWIQDMAKEGQFYTFILSLSRQDFSGTPAEVKPA